MGAAASFERKLDETAVRAVAGEFFVQEMFDEMKDTEGCITIQQLLLAADKHDGLDGRLDASTVRALAGDRFDEDLWKSLADENGRIGNGEFLAVVHKPGEATAALFPCGGLGGGAVPAPEGPVSDDEAQRLCYVDGAYLEHCSESQRDQLTLCICAVSNRAAALEFCAPRHQDHEKLVRIALKFDGTALGYASPRLQADPGLIAEALKKLPSYSMRWEAVQQAAAWYGRDEAALKAAPLNLRGDPDVMEAVVRANGLNLKYAMPYVRRERPVVMAAVAENSQAIFFAAPFAAVVDPAAAQTTDLETAPLDPAVLEAVRAAFEAEGRGGGDEGASSGARGGCAKAWCPDADAVARGVARFPELAAFSPPAAWLEACAARQAQEAEDAEAKKEAIWAKRAEDEKKDAVWGAGLAKGAGASAAVEASAGGGEEAKAEAKIKAQTEAKAEEAIATLDTAPALVEAKE